MERIFLVGCSRSGTTLLQNIIAQNFNLITLPETGFFLPGGFHYRLRQFGYCYKNYTNLSLKEIFDEHTEINLSLFVDFCHQFQNNFDCLSLKNGAEGWLEKSPLHFRRINLIRKNIKNPKFVFIIRDPLSTINSLRRRSKKFEKFHYQTVDYCIRLVNQSLNTAYKFKNDEDVKIIRYENLVTDTNLELEDLRDFINLPIEKNKRQIKLIKEKEGWKKERPLNTIFDLSKQKTESLSVSEKEFILSKINSVLYDNLLVSISKEDS